MDRALGALCLLAALFRPWYELNLPLLSEQLLDPQPAMYFALLSAVMMAGGGILALTADERRPEAPAAAPPVLDRSQVRVWDAS